MRAIGRSVQPSPEAVTRLLLAAGYRSTRRATHWSGDLQLDAEAMDAIVAFPKTLTDRTVVQR